HSPHYPVSLCTLSTDLLILPRSLTSPLFPYTPLFRSCAALPPSPPRPGRRGCRRPRSRSPGGESPGRCPGTGRPWSGRRHFSGRSEEHTSELQSRFDLVCRLLLEKKKNIDVQAILLSI